MKTLFFFTDLSFNLSINRNFRNHAYDLAVSCLSEAKTLMDWTQAGVINPVQP